MVARKRYRRKSWVVVAVAVALALYQTFTGQDFTPRDAVRQDSSERRSGTGAPDDRPDGGSHGGSPVASRTPGDTSGGREIATQDGDGSSVVARLFRDRQSGVMVQATGTIVRLLSDDLVGSRHQRIVVRLSDGRTVLLAHNIDLAKKVPAREGETLTFRGEYEWNDKGGVVHWTHHDPGGRRPGGWILHRGSRYR